MRFWNQRSVRGCMPWTIAGRCPCWMARVRSRSEESALASPGVSGYKHELPRSLIPLKTLNTTDPGFAEAWAKLCGRGSEEDEGPVREAASRIVAEVRARGDAALLELTERLDGWRPAGVAALVLDGADFRAAFAKLPVAARRALKLAADRIAAFHRREHDAEVPPFRDRSGAWLR